MPHVHVSIAVPVLKDNVDTPSTKYPHWDVLFYNTKAKYHITSKILSATYSIEAEEILTILVNAKTFMAQHKIMPQTVV
jgi:hypothetical protein